MTTEQPAARREWATFLGLLFCLSALSYWPILTAAGLDQGQRYIPGLMWTPGVSAIATRLIFHRNLRGLGWRWPEARWAALAYFLPLAYATVAYGAVWLMGLCGMDLARFPDDPLTFVVGGSLLFLVLATGEEIGWRGFLVPALARTMPLGRTALVSGMIWVAWHAPLILCGDYNASANPRWYSMFCFTVMAVSVGLTLAWLRLRSRSVWPAAILHASHGLYVQAFFDRVLVDTGPTHWLTGEFGAALALTTGATAWIFWRARNAVAVPDASSPNC